MSDQRVLERSDLTALERCLPIPDDVLVVECDHTPGGKDGWYVPDSRVILLLAGLAPAHRLFVLAHEASHALLGHGIPADLAHDLRDAEVDRQEREADALAFDLLLTP